MRILLILLSSFFMHLAWANGPYVHRHVDNSIEQAIRIGTDTDGKPLYLCLANLFNSLQPGKTWAGYDRCHVAYGGREYIVNDFKIPSYTLFKNVSWQRQATHPLKVGQDRHGKPLFLCQALFKGSKQPGKTWPGYPHCNISYAGQEIILDISQILGNDNVNHPTHGHHVNNHTHGHRPSQVIISRQ